MAHHSSESLASKYLLGATGEFPDGKLGPDDEGEIHFAVASDATKNLVFVDFGKPVRSIGFTSEQAAELADLLQKKSWECRGIKS